MNLDMETRVAELHCSFLFLVNLAPLAWVAHAVSLRRDVRPALAASGPSLLVTAKKSGP